MTDDFPLGRDTTPQRRILPPDRLDGVAEAVLALARELWVVCDRQIVTEALLAGCGITAAQIDAFQPDAQTQARLDARRAQLLDNLVAALGAG